MEAMLLRIDLIIRCWCERRVGQWLFRTYGIAEIGSVKCGGIYITVGKLQVGVYVEQFTNLVSDGQVKVKEIVPTLHEEWLQVIGIELKEGTFAIGRQQGIPVQVTPVAMVADAHIGHIAFRSCGMAGRHSECLRSSGGGYDTTVTVGLFHEMFVPFEQAKVITIELLEPLHRSEISGRQNGYGRIHSRVLLTIYHGR